MAESVVNIRWAYSKKRQAAYATANPLADITSSHPFLGADMGEHTPNMSDNAAHYGKGHEFATRVAVLSWESMFRRQFHATTKILGWAFAFHTGSISTSNLGGSPVAYQHTFEYQDPLGSGYYGSGRQQPVTTIIEQVTSGLVRRFPSMAVKSVEVTGQQNDWVIMTCELQGSGFMDRIATSAFTWPDPTQAATGGEGNGLLRNASLTFLNGPSGSMSDISCDIRSFRFRSEMQYFEAEGYCPGSGYLTTGDANSGQIRNKLEFSRRAVLLEFQVKASSSNTYFTRLEGSTLLQAQLTVQGGLISGSNYHKLIIDVPQMKYRTVPIGTDGDLVVYNLTAMIFYDNTEANPWKVTVVSDETGYLVSS